MHTGPLFREEIEAGAKLIQEFNAVKPVKASFWLKQSDEPFRYLYIALADEDYVSALTAYRAINPVVRKLGSPDLEWTRIKMINAGTKLAQDAVDRQTHYPLSIGKRFGGIYADDVYLYPPPNTAM